MTFVDKIQNIKFLGFLKVFKNPLSYIFCVGLLSFLISMILGGISVFKINAICIFCFMTYFVNLFIAISAKTREKSIIDEIKTTVEDFVEAIKVKRYAFWFVLLVLLGVSVLAYTTVSNVLSPQIQRQKELKSAFSHKKIVMNGNRLGDSNASLQIDEYMDFNCGGCLIAHIYLHRIVEEFKNIKVVQHNLPLEKVCNHNMQDEGHKNSCLKSSYALAAAKQNMYWEMADILFIQNPETEKEIIEKARLLDFDIKKLKDDANSEEIAQEIKQSIDEADSKAIDSTPTLFIGMKKTVGVGPFPAFRQMILEEGGILKETNEG